MTRRSWWKVTTFELAAWGAAGATAGALVAAARDATITSGISWGLFATALVLLAIGAYPGHQTFPVVPAALPYSVRRHTETHLWERHGRPRSMLSNLVVAVVLTAIGALLALYT